MQTCEYCKTEYQEKRNDQRFCSARCQHKQWIIEHPGKSSQYDKAKYNKNKEAIIERVSKWAKKNPDKVQEYYARWLSGNEEKARVSGIARSIKWAKKNPLKVRILREKRRCSLKGNGGTFTSDEWNALLHKSNGFCLMCRKQIGIEKLTIDHIIPVSRGGLNTIENLQPLCHSCNAKKHTQIIRFDYFKENLPCHIPTSQMV